MLNEETRISKSNFKPLEIGVIMNLEAFFRRYNGTSVSARYATMGGKIYPLMLYHYEEMAKSGASMIVVENASITAGGFFSGSPIALDKYSRCDHNRYLPGLEKLAQAIKGQKSRAALSDVNHAGRFAHVPDPVAPSAVETFGKTPRELTKQEITTSRNSSQMPPSAQKEQGSIWSSCTVVPDICYPSLYHREPINEPIIMAGLFKGGSLFPLEVLMRVKDAVGDFPVGYRFLADEWPAGRTCHFIVVNRLCWQKPWRSKALPIFLQWAEPMSHFFFLKSSKDPKDPVT